MTDTFVHYTDPGAGQQVGTTEINGSDAQWVQPRRLLKRMTATPVISTAVYAAKDAVGGLLTFSGAARFAGGPCTVVAAQVVDKAQQRADMELILFDRAITAPTDNAAFDPTDVEVGYAVGSIFVAGGLYSDFNDNSVATVDSFQIPAILNGTDLYGVLVARATPTFAANGDVVVTLTVQQD